MGVRTVYIKAMKTAALFVALLFLISCDSYPIVSTEHSPVPDSAEIPSAPLNVRVTTTPGSPYVDVYWDPPLNAGSSPIDQYACYTVENVHIWAAEDDPSIRHCLLTVPFGQPLNVIVYAYNDWELKGYHSPPSEPAPFMAVPTVPGIPHFTSAVPGSNQVTLTWSPPADGGAPITAYTILALSSGDSCVWTWGPRSCTFTGLSGGTLYKFMIRATNSVGVSLSDSISVTTGTWVEPAHNSGTTKNLRAVTWTGTQLVAVGDSGTILTSSDGMEWTPQISGVTNRLNGVKWIGNRLIAVGMEGTILTSFDGISWKSRTSGTLSPLYDVDGNSDRVVVVTDRKAIVSFDDSLWQEVSISSGYNRRGILWTGTKFMAVGDMGYVTSSQDGLSWTQRGTSGGSLNSVASGNGRYVVVGFRSVITSGDGNTWSLASGTKSTPLNTVVWNGSRFIALGDGYAVASDDGTSWHEIPAVSTANGSVWTGTKLVVVGNQGHVFTDP